MRILLFFLFPSILVLFAGCGRPENPDYDSSKNKAFREAVTGLGTSSPEENLARMQKLSDTEPDLALPDQAIAYERDRLLAREINQLIRKGELDQVAKKMNEQRRYGDYGTALAEYLGMPKALDALRIYIENKPYASYAEATAAMDELKAQTALLTTSPTFAAFLADEERQIKDDHQAEQQGFIKLLSQQMDEKILDDREQAEFLLAQIVAIDPDHPLPKMISALEKNDWTTIRNLVASKNTPGILESTYLEMAASLTWDELDRKTQMALGNILRNFPPCTISGLLLHARHSAAYGDVEEAMQDLRNLASSRRLTPELALHLIETTVLPRQQLQTPAWQTTCPGVGDYLIRLQQIANHLQSRD